jgi:hypothetical protein
VVKVASEKGDGPASALPGASARDPLVHGRAARDPFSALAHLDAVGYEYDGHLLRVDGAVL